MEELDFTAVIKSHADWKTKLREAIKQKAQIDADALCKDNLCKLGHWLYNSEVQNEIGNTEAYEECRQSHAKFHEEAGKVAREINRENFDKAEDMLLTGSPYASAATDVALALHELRKELGN